MPSSYVAATVIAGLDCVGPYAENFISSLAESLQEPQDAGAIITPILQRRKLRPRAVKAMELVKGRACSGSHISRAPTLFLQWNVGWLEIG